MKSFFKFTRNSFGRAVVFTKCMKKNTLVRVMTGENMSYPTQTTIEWGPGLHIHDEIGKLINHSCIPTLYLHKDKDDPQPILWTAKDIVPGMPLTIDYMKNETIITHPFICNDCGQLVPRPAHEKQKKCTFWKPKKHIYDVENESWVIEFPSKWHK